MPSGYTYLLQEGKDFKTFAKRCLRAFGAYIHMRDEPSDKPPEPRKPSSYHLDELNDEIKNLEKFKKFPDSKIRTIIKNEWGNEVKRVLEYIEKDKNVRKNYEDALSEANAYIPPTSEHEDFKKFMIEQIEKSIEWDCNEHKYQDDLERLGESPDISDSAVSLYREESIARFNEDIEYHKREYQKELDRCEDANTWLEDAITSIDNHKLTSK